MRLTDNPLPDTLIVTPTLTASTPQGTESLKSAIAAMADVQTVQLDTEWVKRLHAMLDLLRRVVLLTGGLLGVGHGAHRQQHHSPRYIEPARRNRGHETGGRVGRLRPPAVSLQRHLVRVGRRVAGVDAGRDRLDGAGSAGRRSWPFCTAARFSLEGLGFTHGGWLFWGSRWGCPGWVPGLLQRDISER